MKVEIEIDEIAAKEIAKLEKRVETLKKANTKLEGEVAAFKEQMKALQEVREAIAVCAYQLDPYYGYDD